jgi:hypothetical protein
MTPEEMVLVPPLLLSIPNASGKSSVSKDQSTTSASKTSPAKSVGKGADDTITQLDSVPPETPGVGDISKGFTLEIFLSFKKIQWKQKI